MPDPTGRISHLPDMHRGVAWKEPCRVATTGSITISTALNAGDSIDGVTLAAGDRVLVKDQGTGSQNGIYVAGATPIRAFDMDQDATTSVPASEVMGAIVYVIAGTANGGTLWRNTNTTAPTIGGTTISFSEVSASGGVEVPFDLGSLGATETIDLANGSYQRGTLDADCTITVTGFTVDEAAFLTLKLTQDGTGGWAITWDTDVVFLGDDQPSQTAGDVSFFTLWSDEGDTTIFAAPVGGGASLTVSDEGTPLDTAVTSIDAVGAGVTATNTGHAVTLTISGVPQGSAGGDLSGTYPNPSVVDDSHSHTSATAPGGGGSDHEHVQNVAFNGDASTTVWILPVAPVDSTSVAAYVSGSRTIDFTLSGTLLDTITFGSAPGSGTNNVVIDIEAAV